MTLEERLKLINAGYTKDEIAAMEEKKEEKKEPEKKEPEKKESGPDLSSFLAEEIAKALAAAIVKPEPEKKEEKKEPEKKEPEKKEEKAQDDEVIKKLISDQLKAFFQPSIKIDPVTDISDISKRFFEVSINKKEGEQK